MQNFESSNIYGAEKYNAANKTLDVTFKNRDGSPGATYRYKGVTQKVAEEFFSAESVGTYLNQVIKPACECEKLPKAEEEGGA